MGKGSRVGWRKPKVDPQRQSVCGAGLSEDPEKFSSLRSALSVPLRGAERHGRRADAVPRREGRFLADNLRILLAISSKVSLSIENALKFRQAESSATTDYLTGSAQCALACSCIWMRELARCQRESDPLAVLVCDLDGFKQINDRFGHLEGNRLLQSVARGIPRTTAANTITWRAWAATNSCWCCQVSTRRLSMPRWPSYPMTSNAGFDVCGERVLSLSVGTAFYGQDGEDAEQA